MSPNIEGDAVIFGLAVWIAVAVLCLLAFEAFCHTATWKTRFYLLGFPMVLGGIALAYQAFTKEQYGDILTALGSVCVAIIAVWKDGIVDALNPAKAELKKPEPDEDICWPSHLKDKYMTDEWSHRKDVGFRQYHIEVENANPSRPLINVRVTFQDYSFRMLEGDNEEDRLWTGRLAVPRQFTWAPHEDLVRRDSPIHRRRVLDLCYIDCVDNSISLILYNGAGVFDKGEDRFNVVKASSVVLRLVLEADNLPPQEYRLRIDLSLEKPDLSYV